MSFCKCASPGFPLEERIIVIPARIYKRGVGISPSSVPCFKAFAMPIIGNEQRRKGSVVILGGLSLVNSLHAYTFASLKRKKLISTTPLNDALNALILALNASAAAFVLLFTKKFRILS